MGVDGMGVDETGVDETGTYRHHIIKFDVLKKV